jgi:hypothetical protein
MGPGICAMMLTRYRAKQKGLPTLGYFAAATPSDKIVSIDQRSSPSRSSDSTMRARPRVHKVAAGAIREPGSGDITDTVTQP